MDLENNQTKNGERKKRDRWLPISIVSERLGCHRSTVYRMIGDGRLPYIKLGESKGWRVRESDLIAFEQESIKNYWEY